MSIVGTTISRMKKAIADARRSLLNESKGHISVGIMDRVEDAELLQVVEGVKGCLEENNVSYVVVAQVKKENSP